MKLTELVTLSNEIRLALVESAGEITDETCKSLLVLEDNLPRKVDGYQYLVKDFEVESEKFKAKADEYSRLAKSFDNYSKQLKERLKLACIAMNVKELVGNEYKWKLVSSKPCIVIDDETKVPGKYKKIIQEIKIDKEMIHEDIKQGAVIEGLHCEPSSHVRAYPLGVKK